MFNKQTFLGVLHLSMYSVAMTYDSMKVALLGRVLCGFGSAEVVNRQLISACVSYQTMTKASALFVSVSAAGMSIGPLVAGEKDPPHALSSFIISLSDIMLLLFFSCTRFNARKR